MKVVLICSEYPLRTHAGIGTVVQIVARGLRGRGHEVTVVGLGEFDEEGCDQGIRVFTLRRSRARYVGNLLSRLRLRRWLSAYVKENRVDVVEVPDSQGLLPFSLPGCTTVVRLHLSFKAVSRATGEKAGPGISLYEHRTLSANRNWIAVSKYVLTLTQDAFNVAPERSIVIHNPAVSIPSELPTVPQLPKEFILYAGHVCSRKGADVLAEAARSLMTDRPTLHLVYVGGVFEENGQPMSEHIRGILGPQLEKRVLFLGRLDHEMVLACMKRARVFAFPSKVEGLPMVILEAMSCGVPVVYTRNPPGPELIDDGVDGLLADPASPADFCEKIARILDATAYANLLAKNARARVADFSPIKCVEATERFYEQCLRGSEAA